MVPLQRLAAGFCGCDEALVDRPRDIVLVEIGLQARRVRPRLGKIPVALEDTVVDRGVGVGQRVVDREVSFEELFAILLVASGEQPVHEVGVTGDHFFAGRQGHGGEVDIGVGHHAVGRCRRRVEARGVGEQAFALFVEDVALLAVTLLDAEAVGGEGGGRVEPLAHGGLGNPQQLGLVPRGGLAKLGENDFDPLEKGLHIVVAGVLGPRQARILVDLVEQLAEFVGEYGRRENAIGAIGQGAFKLLVSRHETFEIAEAGFPGIPVGEDVVEVPLEAIGDQGAVTGIGFESVAVVHRGLQSMQSCTLACPDRAVYLRLAPVGVPGGIAPIAAHRSHRWTHRTSARRNRRYRGWTQANRGRKTTNTELRARHLFPYLYAACDECDDPASSIQHPASSASKKAPTP